MTTNELSVWMVAEIERREEREKLIKWACVAILVTTAVLIALLATVAV